MLNSDLSPAAPQGGRLPPTDKTRVVSTRRRVPTNWVSGRTLQPSIESVVANSFVPSDFLVDGQVSGLGTVHPLITLSFVSTWILPLHVVSSTLKRKSSSSVMDGLQRREGEEKMCMVVMAMVGWVGAGIELVFGKHAGQSQVHGRMSGDAGAFPECVGYTLMTPDRTTIQVRSSGYGRAGIGRSSWKGLTRDAT